MNRLAILALIAVVIGLRLGWQALVTILLFVLILGVTVLVHEVGHFVAARRAGVRVLEFGIGFPPRAKVLANRGETLYTLNWLPIGGFVKLAGEDGTDTDDPRSFSAKGTVTKVLILVAGVAMNLVLALAIFTGIAVTGDPAVGILVKYVDPASPAARAGIVVGDVIERLDGTAYGVFGPANLVTDMRSRAGQSVTILVRHADGTATDLRVTLRTKAELDSNPRLGSLGIGKARVLDPSTGAVLEPGIPNETRILADKVTYPIGTALKLGVDRTVDATQLIIAGVGDILGNFVTRPTEPPAAAGPVGIAIEIGNVFWTLGPIATLYLAGLLSANLAVVNILPLPPLDGGRVVVILLKRFAGRRVSLRAEQLTYLVGYALLFAFLIWVTAFDLLRQLGTP